MFSVKEGSEAIALIASSDVESLPSIDAKDLKSELAFDADSERDEGKLERIVAAFKIPAVMACSHRMIEKYIITKIAVKT